MKKDVHLDLLRIVKMSANLQVKKIKREKRERKVSKNPSSPNWLEKYLQFYPIIYISFRLRPVRTRPVQDSPDIILLKRHSSRDRREQQNEESRVQSGGNKGVRPGQERETEKIVADIMS